MMMWWSEGFQSDPHDVEWRGSLGQLYVWSLCFCFRLVTSQLKSDTGDAAMPQIHDNTSGMDGMRVPRMCYIITSHHEILKAVLNIQIEFNWCQVNCTIKIINCTQKYLQFFLFLNLNPKTERNIISFLVILNINWLYSDDRPHSIFSLDQNP